MPSLALRYFEALKNTCSDCNIKDFSLVHGASEEDIRRLRQKFPDVPETLVQLLALVDGTYYREYKGKEVCIAVFDRADDDISYYLNSVERILRQDGASIAYIYGDPDLEEEKGPEYLADFMYMVGEGIDPFQPFADMLHLSDCINNGGASALYIDFHPAEGGVKGQIVCFMHDPDSFSVIAPSFDAFLEMQLAAGFDWIEVQEEKPQDPAMTALLEGLKGNDPRAVIKLQDPAIRRKILGIMEAVPIPVVLLACLRRLEELHAVYDEMAPSGYTYGPQYEYLLAKFCGYSSVFLNDAPLREKVVAFARTMKAVPLIRQLGLEMTLDEELELFRDNCDPYYAQERYRALSPEAFFEESALAWEQPGFEEFFTRKLNRYHEFSRYTYGKRERMLHLHPNWKARLCACTPPAIMNLAALADMAESAEDIAWLKQWYSDPAHSDYINRLASFCHALCLVGEEQVDAHLPWVFAQVLEAWRLNSRAACLKYSVRYLKEPKDLLDSFTFILLLRPQKSLEMLAHIETMLTDSAEKKACANLVRLLEDRIKEAKG